MGGVNDRRLNGLLLDDGVGWSCGIVSTDVIQHVWVNNEPRVRDVEHVRQQ